MAVQRRYRKKKTTHINSKQSTPLHNNVDNTSTKENAGNIEDSRFTAVTSISKARNPS